MWLGPFKVISVEQPRYVLENAPGRNSRKPVYCRRLRPFRGGMSNISMVKRIARMVFSSRMNNRLIKKGSCTESELRGPWKMQKNNIEIEQCTSNTTVTGGLEYNYLHFASQRWDQRTGSCLVYSVGQKDKTFPAMMANGRRRPTHPYIFDQD